MKQFLLFLAIFASSVTVFAQPSVGSKAPEISLPNATGEMVKLSSLQGKVVVLDFWASWCGPCRRSNREVLQPVYAKYQQKGLEVFAVSIDDNTQAWANAIKQDKSTWLQVIDKRAAVGNELTRTWNLQYIPSTFLIDQQGKIVAIAPEKKELEKWLDKLL